MCNFKFLKDQDDAIQLSVNYGVENAKSEVRDEIDSKITQLSYSIVADVMKKHGLDENNEAIHDELYCEVSDSLYNEIGVY